MKKRLKIPSEGAWSFEAKDVAEDFDHHVNEQLPWYSFVTNGLVHVARHYVPEGGTIIDLGASTGNVGRALRPIAKARGAKMIAVEKSKTMVNVLENRDHGNAGYAEIWSDDATEVAWEDKPKSDLIVAFLFFMFVPPKRRWRLIQSLLANLAAGGAMIVVDRTADASGYVAQILNRLTIAGKVGAGVPADEIIAKELSLSGVQRPFDSRFLPVEAVEFFRYGDFAGWIVEKR